MAIFNFCVLVAILPFIESRIPATGVDRPRPTTLGKPPLMNRRFWLFMAANACQGLGYFIPGLYIPSYAQSLKLTTTQGSAALAAMNGKPESCFLFEEVCLLVSSCVYCRSN